MTNKNETGYNNSVTEIIKKGGKNLFNASDGYTYSSSPCLKTGVSAVLEVA